MSQLEQFKRHDWFPDEFHFFANDLSLGLEAELDPDDVIDDYGVLQLKLVIRKRKKCDSEYDSIQYEEQACVLAPAESDSEWDR